MKASGNPDYEAGLRQGHRELAREIADRWRLRANVDKEETISKREICRWIEREYLRGEKSP